MSKFLNGKIALCAAASVLFLAGCLAGRQSSSPQKTLLHVFVYTPLESATPQDFENFYSATKDMVGKIPGLRNVWVGKLREPIPAEENRIRTYGVGMEFDGLDALAVYANHPVRAEWVKVFAKVRQQGTTTLDILSE